MSESLRAGVVGAGVFGGFHAKKYAELDGVTLIGVYDTHRDRAEQLAVSLGAKAFATLDELLAEVDILTIASPATAHAEEALAALKAGKSIYVEKPLATSLDDADRIAA